MFIKHRALLFLLISSTSLKTHLHAEPLYTLKIQPGDQNIDEIDKKLEEDLINKPYDVLIALKNPSHPYAALLAGLNHHTCPSKKLNNTQEANYSSYTECIDTIVQKIKKKNPYLNTHLKLLFYNSDSLFVEFVLLETLRQVGYVKITCDFIDPSYKDEAIPHKLAQALKCFFSKRNGHYKFNFYATPQDIFAQTDIHYHACIKLNPSLPINDLITFYNHAQTLWNNFLEINKGIFASVTAVTGTDLREKC
jgi:hypothetical protein